MGSVIAIMNAKGGVGKSTTAMMLAEALASQHDKRILVVDTDPQSNSSLMLLGAEKLENIHHKSMTLPALIDRTRPDSLPNIREYIVEGASDVRHTRHLHILPGAVELAWVERDMRDEGERTPVVVVAGMIRELKQSYDFILIDCPPSISFFTECWLRHSDFHLTPSKPELLSDVGLRLVRDLRTKAAKRGQTLAHDMGVLITMFRHQKIDATWEAKLRGDRHLSCFQTVIPQSTEIQRASEFHEGRRNYSDKYKDNGGVVSAMSREFLERHAKLVAMLPETDMKADRTK